MIRDLWKRRKPMKILRHGAVTQWNATPVAPYSVQRMPGTLLPDLVIVEEHEHLPSAVRRAWQLIYPYQGNMAVTVVDARDSIVLARLGLIPHVAEYGSDGAWYGVARAFEVLHATVEEEDVALVEFVTQKAKTMTNLACPP